MRKHNKSMSKKLNLDTETVRELHAFDLSDVAGANKTGSCFASCGGTCAHGCGTSTQL